MRPLIWVVIKALSSSVHHHVFLLPPTHLCEPDQGDVRRTRRRLDRRRRPRRAASAASRRRGGSSGVRLRPHWCLPEGGVCAAGEGADGHISGGIRWGGGGGAHGTVGGPSRYKGLMVILSGPVPQGSPSLLIPHLPSSQLRRPSPPLCSASTSLSPWGPTPRHQRQPAATIRLAAEAAAKGEVVEGETGLPHGSPPWGPQC